MAFQSAQFFVLFAASLLLYYVVPARAKKPVLFGAGLVFYIGAGVGNLLLLLVMIALSYGAALALHAAAAKNRAGLARLVFVAALVLLFGNLCLFKYYAAISAFFRQYAVFGWLPEFGLAAPLGISFYTFTITGYLIDVHLGTSKPERNFLQYALFASFFPLISAGPIERSDGLLRAFDAPRPFVYADFSAGMARILWGFFKKFVLANIISVAVDPVYADMQAYSGPYLALASLLYMYQIYCDFSGYSDIAIGVARTFGLTVRENFNRPLAAASFTDYWQRWHMSLTGWFRDYVFTPLSFALRGALFPQLTGSLCMASIFVLSGIWHGPKLTYFVWGVLNAVFIVFARLTAKRRRALAKKNPLYKNPAVKTVLQVMITYLLATACIVFFRADTLADAFYLYGHLFTGWLAAAAHPATVVAALKSMSIGRLFLVLVGGGALLVTFVEKRAAIAGRLPGDWMQAQKPYIRIPLYYVLLLALIFYGVFGASSFIYFQF